MKDLWTYDQCVQLLHDETRTEIRNGLNMLIKKVPGSDTNKGVLDPRVRAVLQEQLLSGGGLPEVTGAEHMEIEDIPIAQLRAQMGCPNKDVTRTRIQTRDLDINGQNGTIPIRIYRPETSRNRLPGILFFHGGGFMGGTVGVIENSCKILAEKANAAVIAVDYRLAPEHPFPAGMTDCFDTVEWVFHNASQIDVNPEQIAVTGDSAGGNYSTVCALKDRDLGKRIIKYQALIYPSVNLAEIDTDDHAWHIEEYTINNHEHRELILASIYGLKDSLPLVRRVYLQGKTSPKDPYVSPLHAVDLSGMPETLIITAEYDKFRLECEAYARRLIRSGVKTQLIQYNGMDHGFIDKIGIYPQVEDCMNEIARHITRFFSCA